MIEGISRGELQSRRETDQVTDLDEPPTSDLLFGPVEATSFQEGLSSVLLKQYSP
jgi:hypothetical protein